MVLDIDQFRTEKGGNPDKIRENQKNRYCDVGAVDGVIDLDNQWRACRHAVTYFFFGYKITNNLTVITERIKPKLWIIL